MAPGYWLMKTEPDTFGIHDLERVRVEPWTGVRNFTARNFMRDAMQVGDPVLFYHSSVAPPGVAGLARVSRTGVVDETQFDPASPYHDPTARRDQPRWICVEVEYVETLPRLVALDELRANPALADMLVLKKGMRLSVQPVTAAAYKAIVRMARQAQASLSPSGRQFRESKSAGKVPRPRPAPRSPGRAAPTKRAR